jgi:hypothetical protein
MKKILSTFLTVSLIPLNVIGSDLSVPVQSIEALSQVYSITRKYKSMEGPASSQTVVLEPGKPSELLWITGFKTEIVQEDGKTPAPSEFMCHINLDANIGDHKQRFGWTKNVSPRLFTLSQAQFGVEFPRGFAMPVMSDESFSLATQVLNHNRENVNAQVRHKVTIRFARDADLKTPMKPLFSTNGFVVRLLQGEDGNYGMPLSEKTMHGPSCMPGMAAPAGKASVYPDSFGRSFSGHWVVQTGREVSSTNITKMLNLPFDTTVHYINIHLHPFAEWFELKDLTTGKTLFKSKIKGPKKGIGLEHIELFSSEKGIEMYKNHEYGLSVTYNNTSGVVQDAMATMFLYLLDKEFKKPAQVAPSVPVAHAPNL